MHPLTPWALLGGAAAGGLVLWVRRRPAVRDAALCGVGLLTFLAAGFGPDGGLLEAPSQRRLLAAPLAAAAAFVASKARRDGRPRAAGFAAVAAALLLAAAVLPTADWRGDDWGWADATIAPAASASLFAAAFADRSRPRLEETG